MSENGFVYVNTHESVVDGSTAMLVEKLGDLIVLINEDGFAWSDPREMWFELDMDEVTAAATADEDEFPCQECGYDCSDVQVTANHEIICPACGFVDHI